MFKGKLNFKERWPRITGKSVCLACSFLFLNFAESTEMLIRPIADNQLRQCIDRIMNDNGWTKPRQVQFIKCHNQAIVSTQGIHQFSSIRSLSLYKNKIQTIDLTHFNHLHTINLANNQLNRLTLTDLPKLNKLYLFRNDLLQLSLKNLSSLTQVKANDNQIKQLKLTALPKLAKLYLFNNQLKHVELQSLSQLHYLDVRQNPMPDEFYDFLDEQDNLTARHDGNADDWD